MAVFLIVSPAKATVEPSGTPPSVERFYSNGKEDLMPRVNPYRPEQYDYNSDVPSASGALLFVGIVAAVILAAIVWAAYVPEPNVQPGAMNAPTTQSTPAPIQPRTPSPTPAR